MVCRGRCTAEAALRFAADQHGEDAVDVFDDHVAAIKKLATAVVFPAGPRRRRYKIPGDGLYSSVRYGTNLQYTYTMTPGQYLVFLHFSEIANEGDLRKTCSVSYEKHS